MPPVTGAAEVGFGVAASGICPSVQNKARGRVHSDPARAGQIDFRPSVQVDDVLLDAARTVERFHVGLELNRVAAAEASRHPEMPQHV